MADPSFCKEVDRIRCAFGLFGRSFHGGRVTDRVNVIGTPYRFGDRSEDFNSRPPRPCCFISWQPQQSPCELLFPCLPVANLGLHADEESDHRCPVN
jgi:hypothetical protein